MSMRNIYRKIAKEHGVTVPEVKREMQATIDYVYKKIDKSESEKIMQKVIHRKGGIPTTEEFIKSLAHKIENKYRST
ncbi:sporulation initiation factor Spo0A C-terminal domain-containing protein [Desulfosporosinus hippei]|uniref:Sporulation initiation factor Spo0A C terminal n=1 Tax=Desulfosporosinus hippei DSM 8344 TaxID=1121419 RepID=A0A1G7VNC2_9FIRM|nr:sporulation initiation factor Spo0A C-terminal domain-containing protein [Desulfosporosinus hippei]SDG61081.1 Sporulation initiation factor Spo0A C terminal [Desulfosporosinus hippei DSM 8344]